MIQEQTRARIVVDRLLAEASSWDGLVSLTLHGSSTTTLDESKPYVDVDLLFVFADPSLADGLGAVQRFFQSACGAGSANAELCIWRAESGPMHPLRSSPQDSIIPLRDRPVVFFHVSVFSASTYGGRLGSGRSPSPLLTSTWGKCPPLLGKPLAELRRDQITLADFQAEIEGNMKHLRDATRGYWHWVHEGNGAVALESSVAEWMDFEIYEIPAYFARWGLANFERHVKEILPLKLPPLWHLVEFVGGESVRDEIELVHEFLEHRDELRMSYTLDPKRFIREHAATEIRQASGRILDGLAAALAALGSDTESTHYFRYPGGATEVTIGRGLSNALPRHVSQVDPDQIFFLTDTDVQESFEPVRAVAELCEELTLQVVDPNSKSLDTLTRLLAETEQAGAAHDSLYTIFGGGSVGNLGGMVAGLACRGIAFIHVPTTLVAQLDSAIGMKQSVNGAHAKNYFGLFHAPVATVIEPLFLVNLPTEHLVSGLVEALKHGLCQSEELLRTVVDFDPLRPTLSHLTRIIEGTIEAKLEVLAVDPREMSTEQPLELGHKVGHAIEHVMKGEASHGVCIAVGMLIEAVFAHRLGLVSEGAVQYVHENVKAVLRGVSLRPFEAEAIAEQVSRDNHRARQGVPFVFLEEPQVPRAHMLDVTGRSTGTLTAAIESVADGLC